MPQIRPPEEMLYAFSQWLQQWASYALSQAQLYAISTDPGNLADGTNTAANLPDSQEKQPPAHWLELVQSGTPAHWLALFEEYGLESPETGGLLGDVLPGSQMPGTAPLPLQDWLGEFQRGLAQFVQQPEAIVPRPFPVESQAATPPQTQLVHDNKELTVDNGSALQSQDSTVAEPQPSRSAYHMPQNRGDHSHESDPVPEVRGNPARIPSRSRQHHGRETKPIPVRLRLNPKPQSVVPVPVPSPSPDAGENASLDPIQPSQVLSHLAPDIQVGVSAPAGKLLFADPEPTVEPDNEFDQANPSKPFLDSENAMPHMKSAEQDPLPESDLASILSKIKRMEDASISNTVIQELREQSPPEASQSATTQWPELPEPLPPVQPPSNVLADPAHRKRINREQRGRSWNA